MLPFGSRSMHRLFVCCRVLACAPCCFSRYFCPCRETLDFLSGARGLHAADLRGASVCVVCGGASPLSPIDPSVAFASLCSTSSRSSAPLFPCFARPFVGQTHGRVAESRGAAMGDVCISNSISAPLCVARALTFARSLSSG